jgi:hypothetical protein
MLDEGTAKRVYMTSFRQVCTLGGKQGDRSLQRTTEHHHILQPRASEADLLGAQGHRSDATLGKQGIASHSLPHLTPVILYHHHRKVAEGGKGVQDLEYALQPCRKGDVFQDPKSREHRQACHPIQREPGTRGTRQLQALQALQVHGHGTQGAICQPL